LRKFFEFRCLKCNEEHEAFIEYEDIEQEERESKCAVCGGQLKRRLTFGYAKFNGTGFTRRSTN